MGVTISRLKLRKDYLNNRSELIKSSININIYMQFTYNTKYYTNNVIA